MTTKRKAPDRGDSVNCAWRTSLPWSSSSSTCCSQRWQRSWPTRPSQKFWRSWKTLLCLLPTRRWTPFHAQVCMDNVNWLVCGSNRIHCCHFSLVQESLCIPATLSCWDAVITTTMTSPRWWTQAGLRKSTAWWQKSLTFGHFPVK